MGYLGLILALWVCTNFVRRARWWRRTKGKKGERRYRPARAALGNALQSLQVILEPQVKYVVQEMLDEHAEIDDEAGPKDPTAHLLRQAKRIRNGEQMECLTTLLPP